VFEGGFTLAAAEAVVAIGETASILDLLQALRDKSLLLVQGPTPARGPEMRFGMYTTVREYARERLQEMGIERETFERHAQHYLRKGLTWAARAEGRRSLEARAWLAAEQDNVLAVHRRALEPPVVVDQALRAALVLQPQLITQGPAALRLEVLDRALACVPPNPDQYIALLAAWSLLARSDGLLHLGRMSEAEEGFPRVLEVARRYGERHLEGRCHWRLGSLSWFRADTKLAREHVERALVVFREAPDRVHEGRTLSSLGLLQTERGDLEAARESFRQALTVHEEAGDRRWLGVTSGRLGELEDHAGRPDDARRLYNQALSQHRALRNRRHEAQTLIALAALEQELGDKPRARELYEQALRLHEKIADRRAEALGRAQLGICLFELGSHMEAAERFDEARSIAQRLGNPRIAALVAAWRIPLELERGDVEAAHALAESAVAHARELEDAPLHEMIALCAAEIDLATGERERARARLEESRALAARSAIVRRAARRLESALACEPPADVLVMATNGAWFRPAGGARVDLQNRRSLRLLLSELTRRRFERAGEPIGIEELFAIGWPGERARREAALSRVYVALSTLRKLGLKGVLIKRDEGYLLDERIPIERWS
jgi:tetratricopeptide (TPR) repeat protein